MWFNQYPYLNLNDLNLDFLLKAIRDMKYEVENFVSINAIKYANPIQWDITKQYEKNTVVIDPVSGTAYISVAPVPAGVVLTRPEYWTVIFDLSAFVTKAAQNFTSRYEDETTTTATFSCNAGDWLVWGDVLYKALVNINAGDSYVVNSNIEHITIEDVINAIKLEIANNAQAISDINDAMGDLNNLITTDKTTLVGAINEVKTGLIYATPEQYGAVGDGVTDDTSALQAAIDNNAYVIGNGNYAFTELSINNNNSVVIFNGKLTHIGNTSNLTLDTTTAFGGIPTVSTWASEYNAVTKYAIKLAARWCTLKINEITTAIGNSVALLLEPDGANALVDHCNVKVQFINGAFACGVMLYAESNQNIQYNSLSLRQCEGSISSIALIAAQTDAWVNANYFHDSQIQTGGVDMLFQNLDNDYASDNWFEHLSFEGVSNAATVRCYNLRNGGFRDFRYEEVASIPMIFNSCTKILLNAFTYFVFSTSLSLMNCSEIIFKGYLTIAGGSRLVDEDVATWKYISQNVNASDNISDLVGINGNMTRFGNIVETYIIGSGNVTVPANGNIQIGTYADKYMSQHDDLYYPVVGNANLSIRFKTRAITLVNNSASAITITLKPQVYRWITNRIFV